MIQDDILDRVILVLSLPAWAYLIFLVCERAFG
jgi:hypothetical protein